MGAEIAAVLIEAGCGLNLRNEDGDTALHLASWESQEGSISLLIKAGCDPNLKNKNGEMPFDIATPPMREVIHKEYTALLERSLPEEWELQTETLADLIASFFGLKI